MDYEPQSRIGLTDMSFALLRCELADALITLGHLSHCENDDEEAHVKKMEGMLETVEARLHERYLQYCTFDIDNHPDQWSAINIGRIVSKNV